MRRVLLILFALLLASCTTLTMEKGGLPSWIEEKPVIAGFEVFVSKGEGESELEARSNALENILTEMSQSVGYDLRTLYFRDLFSTKEIPVLGVRIADEYSYQEDGIWTCHVAVTAEESIIADARSPENLEAQKRTERVKEHIERSLEEYRNNRDMKAVEELLEGMLISLEGSVTDISCSPSSLLDKAIFYLGQLSIESVEPGRDTEEGTLLFRVVRKKGLMYPPLEDGVVECTYVAVTTTGEEKEFSLLARTDSKGRFSYEMTNPYTLRSGELKISLNIDSDLMFRLSLSAPEELMDKLETALEWGSVVFDYSLPSHQDSSRVLFALAEYSYDGTLRGEDGALESVIRRVFPSSGLDDVVVAYADGDDENENIESVLPLYSSMDVIYLIRMGVVGRNAVGDRTYSRAEGTVIKVDVASGDRSYTENFHFSTSGATAQEADDATLYSLSEIICGFLLGEF